MVSVAEFQQVAAGSVAAATAFVAIIVLTANPRRNWNQWLGFFLLLVSGNFAAQSVNALLGSWAANGQMDPLRAASLGRAVTSAGYVCLIFDPAVLAYFASLFPRRTWLAEKPAGLALLTLPVLVFLFFELSGHRLSAPMPMDPVRFAFFGYLGACYLYAAWRLLANFVAEPSSVMAGQARLVVIGALIALVPRVALLLDDLAVDLGSLWGPPLSLRNSLTALSATMASRFVLLWVLFAALVWWVRRQSLTEDRRSEVASAMRLVAVAFGFFTVLWAVNKAAGLAYYMQYFGSLPLILDVHIASEILTFGVRWFVFSIAILFGIVRYEVLAVDRRVVGVASVGAGAGVTFLLVGVEASTLGPWLVATVATLVFLATVGAVYTLLPERHAGHRAQFYLHERGLDTYRVMLASTLAEPEGSKETEAELEKARRRLGITDREHETLLAIAQFEQKSVSSTAVLGRYEVVRRLGAGGFATAHLCRDRSSGRLVVLKHIQAKHVGSRAAMEAALRELEVARRVSHPNLVAIQDMVRLDDGAVVVLEFAEGGSLRDLLERQPRLPRQECARLLRQVLVGLGALHEAGIVHGDLKPENILLAADGTPKLADFGTARAVARAQTLVRGTAGRDAPGTLLYMAPEQVKGLPATPQSDLYALGVVVYEMLAGRSYVDSAGKSAYEVMQRIVQGPPRTLAGLPAGWESFLARALAPRSEERYRSAAEMAGALDLAAEGGAEAQGATFRLRSPGRRWARL